MPAAKTVRRNVVANGVGRVWAILTNIAFVPVYIRFLGGESYGLVVFYVTLVAALQVLDAGLSTALSRELAVRLGTEAPRSVQQSARNLVRTVEVLSWLTGLLIGMAIMFGAPLIAEQWLRSAEVSFEVRVNAIRLMGAVIAVQWPSIAYSGALMGMQRQVRLNLIRMCTSSVQAFGLLAVLALYDASIGSYFSWVFLAQAVNTIWLRKAVWSSLVTAGEESARFLWSEIAGIWRFAASMAGIAFLSSVLTQADKIVLSKIVSLAEFGAYGVAFTVCGALGLIAHPVLSAAVPRYTQLFTLNSYRELRTFYLLTCELVSIVAIPTWMILAFYSDELMSAWMGSGEEAAQVASLVRMISCGWLANALVTLPYGLQIASGWTQLSVRKNIVAISIVLPGLFLVVPHYGAVGAAAVWIVLNLGYVLLEIPLMHRKLLRDALGSWYGRAVVLPIVVGTVLGWLSRRLMPAQLGTILELVWMSAWFILILLVLVLTLPESRRAIVKWAYPARRAAMTR